jgi:hypothetical protein
MRELADTLTAAERAPARRHRASPGDLIVVVENGDTMVIEIPRRPKRRVQDATFRASPDAIMWRAMTGC